jgi:hypothetical protein
MMSSAHEAGCSAHLARTVKRDTPKLLGHHNIPCDSHRLSLDLISRHNQLQKKERSKVMPNWCSNYTTTTGKAEALAAMAEEVNAKLKPQGDEYALAFEHWGAGNDDWLLIRKRLNIEGGVIAFRGDSAWYPPISGYEALSRKHPSLTFVVSYSVDGPSSGGTWLVEDGKARQTVNHNGYFHTPESAPQLAGWIGTSPEGSQPYKVAGPIHHWLLEPHEPIHSRQFTEGGDIYAALRQAGLVVSGEEDKGQITVRDVDQAAKLLRSQFPGVPVWCAPYTLDEETYIGSIQTRAELKRSDWLLTIHELRRLVEIAERDVILTHPEVEHLRAYIARMNEEWAEITDLWNHNQEQGWAKRLTYVKTYGAFQNDIIRDRYRRYLGSLAIGEKPEFHPIAAEIRVLLLTINNERRQELQRALDNPRWIKMWPLWDISEAERKEEEARRNLEPLDEDSFLKELDEIKRRSDREET